MTISARGDAWRGNRRAGKWVSRALTLNGWTVHMRAKTNGRGTKRREKRDCKHSVTYETDWLGRTYVGCSICGRWKRLKTKPAPPDSKRLAA